MKQSFHFEKYLKVMKGENMNASVVDSKYGFNYFKLRDPENLLQIKSYGAELEKSRTEDLKSVMKSVNEVRSDVETLKSEVSNATKMENTAYLRKIMLGVEEKITHLKEGIKEELLKLLRNEVSLSKDIQFMERRMEDWNKPLDRKIFKPVKESSYKVRKINDDNPVIQFQKFLSQSGGHYGGWEEQDHLLFLKERRKYKKKEKFFSALHSLVPHLSYEMIEEHEEWYKKYESLRDSQKEAIKKWRLEKETQQYTGNEETAQEKIQVKKKVHQRINIAQRIKEWKDQQVLKKLEEEERQKKEKEKLKEEEKRKQELQEMKKLAVAQYKAEKLNKLKAILPRENQIFPAHETKVKNKILLKAFRLQDLKYIEKKKVIRLQIESASSEKLRLTKPALEFILQRNPQRIFQPTQIWSQHCLESKKREKINPVFDLNSIPRLAIPEWRKELK